MPHQRTGCGRSAAAHNPNGGCRTGSLMASAKPAVSSSRDPPGPAVADGRNRTPSSLGELAEAEELAGPRGRHRELDGSEALDLQAQAVRLGCQLHAERGLRVAA